MEHELSGDPNGTPFFKIHGVFATNYSMYRLQDKDVVYIKLSLNHTKSYVGSTKVGMIQREANRRRKYAARKTLKGTEPAFLWWSKTQTYWEFCPVVLQLHENNADAIREEKRIQTVREPELVAPWIWKFVDRPTQIWLKFPKLQGKKVRANLTPRRAARKSWEGGKPPPAWSNPRVQEAWSILCELSAERSP